MIESRYLTHPSATPTFWTWEPSSPVLQALLIATLTTILSYQFTALVVDLCLGLKAGGSASVRDISALLLADESSVLGVCAAVFRSTTFSRWHFHGLRTQCPKAAAVRDTRTSRFPAFAPKLLLLLIVAPAANLAAIVLSLERDEPVTFAGARFGGAALGLRTEQGSVRFDVYIPGCIRFKEQLAESETPIARFLLCSDLEATFKELAFQPTIRVTVSENSEVKLSVLTPSFSVHQSAKVDIRVGREVYRLKSGLTPEDGEALVQRGQLALRATCRGELFEEVRDPVVQINGEVWSVSQQVLCTDDLNESATRLAIGIMLGGLTLVDSERLQVMVLSDLEAGTVRYTTGDALPFFERHKTFISCALLAIVTLCMTSARLVVSVFSNNDLHMGQETILKEKMGLLCCDSMLQSKAEVVYEENLDVREDPLLRKRFMVAGLDYDSSQ